jgi:alternate signal-mediated exported protein
MDQNTNARSLEELEALEKSLEAALRANAESRYEQAKKKSIKKSMIATIGLIVATIAIFSAQTYAYFTDSTTSAQNQIVAGDLDIDIVEMSDPGQGQTAQIDPVNIMPGTSVGKIVRIKNTGDLPVYVRIKIEKSINKAESEIPADWKDLISCNFKLDNVFTTDAIEGLWTYKDGYYYYNVDLSAGSTTASLFDTIYFSPEMGNEFTNSQITFKVICQATQANGNAASPLDAWGWPAENSSEQSAPEQSN